MHSYDAEAERGAAQKPNLVTNASGLYSHSESGLARYEDHNTNDQPIFHIHRKGSGVGKKKVIA